MTRGAIVTKAILLLLGITLSLSGCVAEPVGYSYDRYPYGTTGGTTATGIIAAGAMALPIADSAGTAASVGTAPSAGAGAPAGTVTSAGAVAEVIAKPL